MARSQGTRKPHRIRRKKPIWRNRFFRIAIVVLLAVAAVSYILIFSEAFQIKTTQISGNQTIKTEDLDNLVKPQLLHQIWFRQSHSIFLANARAIEEDILEKFPAVASAKLTLILPDKLVITIRERVAVAVFARDNRFFLIDEEGIIFKELSDDTGAFLEIYELRSEKEELKLGNGVLTEIDLSRMLAINDYLTASLQIPLDRISIWSDQELRVKTVEGWEIYLNPGENLDWQLEKLQATLAKQIPQERRPDLEYIELRFGDQAYYKYQP